MDYPEATSTLITADKMRKIFIGCHLKLALLNPQHSGTKILRRMLYLFYGWKSFEFFSESEKFLAV